MIEEQLREIERRAQLWREGWDQTDETVGRIKREDVPALIEEVRWLKHLLNDSPSPQPPTAQLKLPL